MEEKIEEACAYVRKESEVLRQKMFGLLNHSHFDGEQQFPFEHSEMKANIMLAVRHLEDARMRVGKVIQAMDGGKSVYTK